MNGIAFLDVYEGKHVLSFKSMLFDTHRFILLYFVVWV